MLAAFFIFNATRIRHNAGTVNSIHYHPVFKSCLGVYASELKC